ncbi:phospholipase A1-Ibeta2, chloroplastic-like [Phalaenopsis equestris]|uniref:phospholipase A1-Ibeta2, chloroplastic-like n=1 Tax=Phalaenopsis equestris TaxID=78828 RepID=UPI0009E22BF8|nr:phospholipase A1-Ibeta2, chloroplastic-like [Phalaenopsis equestris]
MLIAPTLPGQSRLSFPAPSRLHDPSHITLPQSLKITNSAASASASIDTQTHISNLDRILQKTSRPTPSPIPAVITNHNQTNLAATPASNLFNLLNISNIFPSLRIDEAFDKYSPRSLTRLHRLLSDSPRSSPKSSIASHWRLLHGAENWSGLLDPLDENLRRELVRYGEFIQAAYTAFFSNPDSPRHVVLLGLSPPSYRVTRSLFATSSVELPRWLDAAAASALPSWMTQPSSMIGFVAVCDGTRELARMGRRDIVVSLRGTATALEWAENFRSGLQPISDSTAAKVSSGFYSLYKTEGSKIPSLSSAVVEEVRRLVEKYKGEELSITITGHSLGAALAQLVADEISSEIEAAPPIAVVSFGGPRVGNRAFAERLEEKGVKVLRIVNANDVVPRVPGVLPRVWDEGYSHVGVELKVDNRVSPYLRPDADPACCHDLEAYLHLVDGFMGTGCPFRVNAKRSLARLLSQQRPNMKKIYVTRARAVQLEAVSSGGRAG